MEPLTAVTTGVKAAEYGVKGWNWLRRLWSGSVVITRPENRKATSSEWVTVEGTHKRVAGGKYYYWLMTTNGTDWWPAEELKLNINGKWDGRVNVGKTPGPRSSIVVVVRVTPALHAVLTEVKRLRHKACDYAGIKIPQRHRWGWDVVTLVDIQIPPGEIKVGETS
jgi:hypothetical protein